MKKQSETQGSETEKCFVIMPISDPTELEYQNGHFYKIYDQILKPAIIKAGYTPHRADDDKSSDMIHASIIKDIIEAPMAICDLSTRNPNVLFELGIRQAFNKPVVLVQEKGTKAIFDVAGIRTIDYRKNRLYDEVLEDQDAITEAILATKKDPKFNSLITLVKMEPAKIDKENLTENDEIRMMLSGILNELDSIKGKVNNAEISKYKDYTFHGTDRSLSPRVNRESHYIQEIKSIRNSLALNPRIRPDMIMQLRSMLYVLGVGISDIDIVDRIELKSELRYILKLIKMSKYISEADRLKVMKEIEGVMSDLGVTDITCETAITESEDKDKEC